MVKNLTASSNYEIISRNSDLSKKLSDHNLVKVSSEEKHPLDTNNVNTTTIPSATESVSVCGGGVVGEKLNWNFFEHFDQVDNQLRIEVLHVPKYYL